MLCWYAGCSNGHVYLTVHDLDFALDVWKPSLAILLEFALALLTHVKLPLLLALCHLFLLALHAEYIFFHSLLPHEVTHDKTVRTSAWEATFYTKFTISLGCINRYTCCGWESGATEVSAGKTKYKTNPFDAVYSCAKINDYVFLSSGHFLCVFKWCLSEGCKCSRSQVYQG